MSDKIKRIIPVNPDLSVILYEAPDPRDGSYISIKHNDKINNMPGEALVAPADIPALTKALTEAAIESTKSGHYMAGYSDGTRDTLFTVKSISNDLDKDEYSAIQ